ncbi:hypothetical protein [Streptococcus infantis]|uniref:hypothetical protein n=1 Tax=Streptococcus infantis TaxID=68892 RepID=UPI000A93F9D7|nr:hypothetical protein [Streptococcus infantis]
MKKMKVFENFKVETLSLEGIYCCIDEKNSKNNQKIQISKIFSAKRLTYFLNVIE